MSFLLNSICPLFVTPTQQVIFLHIQPFFNGGGGGFSGVFLQCSSYCSPTCIAASSTGTPPNASGAVLVMAIRPSHSLIADSEGEPSRQQRE